MKKYAWIVLLLSVNAVRPMHDIAEHEGSGCPTTTEVEAQSEGVNALGKDSPDFDDFDDDDEGGKKSPSSVAGQAGEAGSSAVNAEAGESAKSLSKAEALNALRGDSPEDQATHDFWVKNDKYGIDDTIDSFYRDRKTMD